MELKKMSAILFFKHLVMFYLILNFIPKMYKIT